MSRTPYESVVAYRDQHGWTSPRYSSRDGDLAYDYHVTLDPARAPIEYNYKSLDALHTDGWSDADLLGDSPGASVFLRVRIPSLALGYQGRAGQAVSSTVAELPLGRPELDGSDRVRLAVRATTSVAW